MTFEMALAELRAGRWTARYGCLRAGVFLNLAVGSWFVADRAPLLGIYPE